MYAYAHTPLDEKTIKPTSLFSGTNVSLSYEAFMVLKNFPIFSQNKCQFCLKLL